MSGPVRCRCGSGGRGRARAHLLPVSSAARIINRQALPASLQECLAFLTAGSGRAWWSAGGWLSTGSRSPVRPVRRCGATWRPGRPSRWRPRAVGPQVMPPASVGCNSGLARAGTGPAPSSRGGGGSGTLRPVRRPRCASGLRAAARRFRGAPGRRPAAPDPTGWVGGRRPSGLGDSRSGVWLCRLFGRCVVLLVLGMWPRVGCWPRAVVAARGDWRAGFTARPGRRAAR